MLRLLLMFWSLFSLLAFNESGGNGGAGGAGGNGNGGNGGGNGGGGGGNGGGGNDKGDPPWLAGLQSLLARNGNNDSAVAQLLYQENHGHRQKIRELEGKVPPAGAVVLTADQAAQWQAYQQLGVPDALKTALTEADTAKANLAKHERAALLGKAAEAHGYNAAVLAKLPGFEQPVALKERSENGKTIRTAVVQAESGEVSLNEFVQQHYAEFLPALQPQQQRAQGTRFPGQAPSNGGGTHNAGQSYLAQAYKKKEAS